MEQDDDARSYMEQDDDARSYMQQDDNARSYMELYDSARSYMEQDNEASQPYDNETPPEEEEDNDEFAAAQILYQNNWDGDLHFDCSSSGGAIFKFQSIHHNHYEDRRWRFDCKRVGCL